MSEAGRSLEVTALSVRYGVKIAVEQVNFTVATGGALAIAGSNGAGKSSLLGALAGLVPVSHGRVSVGHEDLPAVVRARVRAGVRLVPEQGKIYPLMSVAENLAVANRIPGDVGIDDTFAWFPRLKERRMTLAGNLSGGEQQMLGIAMAVLGSPRVLLLDEPTLGLSVPVIHDLAEKLRALRSSLALTLLVAESDAKWLPLFTDGVAVLDRGAIVAQYDAYTPEALRAVEHHMVGLETA